MTKNQEARILSNQVLIMQALALLTLGKGGMHTELNVRVIDTNRFIAEYLK